MANATPTLVVIKSLRKFCRSTERNIKLTSRLGQFLYEYQDIGVVSESASIICFSASQKHELEQQLRKNIGAWIFEEDNLEKMDRLAIARLYSNEKLARVKPNDNYVLIKSNSAIALLNGNTIAMPAEVSLRLPIELIDLSAIKQVVCIENQVAFDQIHQANLPKLTQNALFIYRGHDSLSKGCKTFLSQLPNDCEVIAFCDYDPKGVEISLQFPNIDTLTFPTLTDDLLDKNHIDDFNKQHASFVYLSNNVHGQIQAYIDTMKIQKLSLKQEHMIALNTPLVFVNV